MRDPFFRMALILGLLSAVGPFAIDMYLPALPDVARELAVSEGVAAQTLTAYFVTFGIAQLFYGPLADSIGRKKPLLIGVSIFIVATFLASMAPSIGWLLVARAVQGIGAATLMVVPRAVIRDVATGPAAAKMMAGIMIVVAISPMLAPLSGTLILTWGDWRDIFKILAAVAVLSLAMIWFVLPETLAPVNRRPVRVEKLMEGGKRLLTDRRFMGLTMIGGFGISSFFVFLSNASFVYTHQYGLSPAGFSIAFAVNAIGFFSASQFAGTLAEKYGIDRVISISVTGFVAVTSILTVLIWAGFDALPIVVVGLFLANAFFGLVMPTVTVMAMDPHPDIAGLASSLGGTIQMLTGGVMILIAGTFMNNTSARMVLAIWICAILAWLAAVLSLPRLRFTRAA